MSTSDSRRTFSWALYDWANSAFATTVMAGFFPIFFKQYWSQDVAICHCALRDRGFLETLKLFHSG
jgi:MFS-type transporter involved in bile tolerance (Atg22 family)